MEKSSGSNLSGHWRIHFESRRMHGASALRGLQERQDWQNSHPNQPRDRRSRSKLATVTSPTLKRFKSCCSFQLHYLRLPSDIKKDIVLLMDATVATGAAAMMAIRVLLDHFVEEENIILVSLLMAEQGKPSEKPSHRLKHSLNCKSSLSRNSQCCLRLSKSQNRLGHCRLGAQRKLFYSSRHRQLWRPLFRHRVAPIGQVITIHVIHSAHKKRAIAKKT